MITSLNIVDPASAPIPWLAKTPALAKPRKFDFKPGLNILWGRNGCGKTTLIKLIARMAHCEQGGVPVVTQTSVDNMFASMRGIYDDKKEREQQRKLRDSVDFEHDGQSIQLFDPSSAVGLAGGGAYFDDDFFTQGVHNTLFKGSAGQTTLYRFDGILAGLVEGRKPRPIERRITASRVNEHWARKIEICEHFLTGRGKEGPATILLDEPERSVDLPTQLRMWRFLRAYAPRNQFIIASHSLIALRIPEANYIEMEDGYMAQSLDVIARLPDWPREVPRPLPKAAVNEMKKTAKKDVPKATARRR